MADEESLELKSEGKGKSKLVLFGVIGLVLVLVIGAGLWFFLGSSDAQVAPPDSDPSSAAAPAVKAPVAEANYISMPRPFLFNLPGTDRSRIVEIKVQLMVRGSDDGTLTQKHIPLIEDALLTTFSGADVQKLSTQAGKDELRQLALLNVQNTLQPVIGRTVVEKVLFTGFVMQ
jgi:flagellar protein FliL